MSSYRLARSLATLRTQLDQKFPDRSIASDGWIGDAAHTTRDSDHNPWIKDMNKVGVVTALDVTHDPASGCDAYLLVRSLITNRDSRVKYVIYNRRIWRSYNKPGVRAWMPQKYTGSNPHTRHAHVSVKSTQEHYDSETPWDLKLMIAKVE